MPLMAAGGFSGAAYWGANDRMLWTLGLRVGYRLKAEALNRVKGSVCLTPPCCVEEGKLIFSSMCANDLCVATLVRTFHWELSAC